MRPCLPTEGLRCVKLLIAWSVVAATAVAADAPLPDRIEFNRDVRPILAENCFKCHGFDKGHREGHRRIDTREGVLADNDGIKAIVPGDLGASEIHVRIHSTDKDEMMPPPKSGKKTTGRERAILDRWIAQGAEYQAHWSYIRPEKTAVPEADDKEFVKNPIDAFVLARQHDIGLQHGPEADRATLLRRLSFDLTGLPPSQLSVAAFVGDPAPDACEKQVDRILASPAFGERMAVLWLDLVRYADSIGYYSDNPRNVWPYRDYVIQAFIENKPFDQFTIEQLAGDLLPGSTDLQKVASGFNRLNLTTEEVGAQAAEYEARAAADRVRALGTVWLAQTTGCCQCHDHKYDPIKTRDFYRLAAFFADIQEPSIGPREEGLALPTPAQQVKLRQLEEEIAAIPNKAAEVPLEFQVVETAWERVAFEMDGSNRVWKPLSADLKAESDTGASFSVQPDGSVLVEGAQGGSGGDTYTLRVRTNLDAISGFRLEALAPTRQPESGLNLANEGFVLREFSAAIEMPGGRRKSLKLNHASATSEQAKFRAAAAIDGVAGMENNGWSPASGLPSGGAIYFELAEPLIGSGEKVLVFTLCQNGGRHRRLEKFRLSATTAPGLVRAPSSSPVPQKIAGILQRPPPQRTSKERNQIAQYFQQLTPALARERNRLLIERRNLTKEVPRCLVSESMQEPRVVRILARGNWRDESGEIVGSGVPEFLPQPANPDGHRLTRLDLARWLVSRDNPLTARVFVNRLWKLYFGIGLSKVLDDVGAQGEPPANPALLDWLACDFMESGWDIKRLTRLIVTSGTYRQSSRCPPELQQRDPSNREFARQSRFRLDAEFVRDNALAISGLLVREIGGPSAAPYQPAGYWDNLKYPPREWQPSTDENQWRRGLYTWWQRSYMHPSLLAFDAPTREECTAERTRSNIPQQALALLNDPTYVEAARVFAARILYEGGTEPSDRLGWAFREALSRAPRVDEVQTLRSLLARQSTLYTSDPVAAAELVKTGFSPSPKDLKVSEFAAWTNVARVILNLHETITRF